MSSDGKLTKDEEFESVDSTKYQGMIGSSLYLTTSRPDIMFSVCLCARFQEDPKTYHLEAVRIMKQTALAISTTKAEYIRAEKACQQALWMKQALIDYDIRLDDETYKNVSQDIRDQLNAEAKAVQIILTGIDNDIYSTVDACPNACEMRKAIERLKHSESINVQDLETNLYWEFRKFTSQDGESLELYYSRNRGKAIVNSPQPIYDQEPSMVTEDDETSKDKEIDKLMALISLSFKKIYKPTNNNLRTSSNTSRANQDNSPRINKSVGYENQRIEQANWRDDTDDDELEDQELEAHYMYMAQLQEVSPDAADSGPIFDDEPLKKVSNDNHYNVFAMESKHPEQSESVHDTYPIDQDAHNMIIDSLDM
nr:retrovirus-related Pol polyprotein from transposon TNT 1-94 [Tanacetum cinerariifolium]